MKKLVLMMLTLAFLIMGCGGEKKTASDKLQVAASFYPMAEFARNVGGDKAEVFVLVPDGAEAHDWEPSPADLTKLGKAQVFVYNGVVEPWAKQALTALSERKILAVQTGLGLYERAVKFTKTNIITTTVVHMASKTPTFGLVRKKLLLKWNELLLFSVRQMKKMLSITKIIALNMWNS